MQKQRQQTVSIPLPKMRPQKCPGKAGGHNQTDAALRMRAWNLSHPFFWRSKTVHLAPTAAPAGMASNRKQILVRRSSSGGGKWFLSPRIASSHAATRRFALSPRLQKFSQRSRKAHHKTGRAHAPHTLPGHELEEYLVGHNEYHRRRGFKRIR